MQKYQFCIYALLTKTFLNTKLLYKPNIIYDKIIHVKQTTIKRVNNELKSN